MVVCGLVWWVDPIQWSGLAVVVCSDGLVCGRVVAMVCCGIRMRCLISDLIVLYSGLGEWFHGLIWRSE